MIVVEARQLRVGDRIPAADFPEPLPAHPAVRHVTYVAHEPPAVRFVLDHEYEHRLAPDARLPVLEAHEAGGPPVDQESLW